MADRLKFIGWGLSYNVLEDFSRYILAWPAETGSIRGVVLGREKGVGVRCDLTCVSGCEGAGGCVIASQARQENFSRTCWITFH